MAPLQRRAQLRLSPRRREARGAAVAPCGRRARGHAFARPGDRGRQRRERRYRGGAHARRRAGRGRSVHRLFGPCRAADRRPLRGRMDRPRPDPRQRPRARRPGAGGRELADPVADHRHGARGRLDLGHRPAEPARRRLRLCLALPRRRQGRSDPARLYRAHRARRAARQPRPRGASVSRPVTEPNSGAAIASPSGSAPGSSSRSKPRRS